LGDKGILEPAVGLTGSFFLVGDLPPSAFPEYLRIRIFLCDVVSGM
jgi:hypothetical protein